jgi:general secretion pathway protein K
MKGYFEKSPLTPLYQRGGAILEFYQRSGGFQKGCKISPFGKGGLRGILRPNVSPLKRIHNQQGVALVVVLLALVLLTAMVVEFSYGVYTGTNDLYNWRDAQRLSVMAKSGVNVSAYLLSNKDMVSQYTESIEMPIENPFEDFNGIITVRIEDEDAKFNLNAIIPDNDFLDESDLSNPYNCFKRLLKALSLDVKIADRLVDWIDENRGARLSDSEVAAKNSALDSVDELLLINGISRKDYDKLLPYVTVSKKRDNLIVNVNRAEAPVLMSLADGISEDAAKKVVQQRKGNPFTDIQQFNNTAVTSLGSDRIRIDGTVFCIKSTASSGGVKRVIETVLDTTTNKVQYWKEY